MTPRSGEFFFGHIYRFGKFEKFCVFWAYICKYMLVSHCTGDYTTGSERSQRVWPGMNLTFKWSTWAFWGKTHLSGPVSEGGTLLRRRRKKNENIRGDPSAPKAQKIGNHKFTVVGVLQRFFLKIHLSGPLT